MSIIGLSFAQNAVAKTCAAVEKGAQELESNLQFRGVTRRMRQYEDA